MKSAFNRSILALAAILVVAGAGQASAQAKPLKSYRIRNQGILDPPAGRLVPRRRDRSPEGPGAAIRAADRRLGGRTRRADRRRSSCRRASRSRSTRRACWRRGRWPGATRARSSSARSASATSTRSPRRTARARSRPSSRA